MTEPVDHGDAASTAAAAPPETDDEAVVKTYRYLRLGMVGVVVMLAASVLVERSEVDCWQRSISAYYFTPVRAILVGGLMAVGLSLIVIKGRTTAEEACLNVAGMLAPVVAVVPTSDVGTCWSEPPEPLPIVVGENGDEVLADWVVANIDNNIAALLIVGFLGLAAVAVLTTVLTREPLAVFRRGPAGTRIGLWVTFAILAIGALAFTSWDEFDTAAHGISAVGMFAFLGAAIAVNAWQRRDRPDEVFGWLYLAIAIAMLLVAIVFFFVRNAFDHAVLVVESVEIALFAVFWVVQTIEYWQPAEQWAAADAEGDRARAAPS
jgi:hypothetical protein